MATSRIQIAVALGYDEEMSCPVLLGRGREEVAKEMARVARRYGVPVVEKGDLVNELAQGNLAEGISESHYEVVAEAIAETSVVSTRSRSTSFLASERLASPELQTEAFLGEVWTRVRIPRSFPRE